MDIFKVNRYKEDIQKLHEENAQLIEELNERDRLLTDEHYTAIGIIRYLESLHRKLAELSVVASLKEVEIQKLDKQKEALEEDVVELKETKLLQDFGLYEPMYDFAYSSQYQERLCACREEQKRMVKAGEAAVCKTNWTVNGSLSAGKKMTNNNITSALLVFNTECENAVNRVKFNNYDMMERSCVFDGTPWTCYLCESCQKASSELGWQDEYGFGDLRERSLEIERESNHADDHH